MLEVALELLELKRHPDRVRCRRREAVSSIEMPSWWVSEEIDQRTGWSFLTDAVHKLRKDFVADPPTLMFGKYCHVHDVEVPPTVAEDTAHSNGFTRLGTHDVASEPAARKRGPSLL
jgi:hypothetical protein